MTENVELADVKQYEFSVEDHPNPHQHHHNTVVSEWNGVESGNCVHNIITIKNYHHFISNKTITCK